MLVFAAHTSERLKYILDHLLIERLGIAYKVTNNPEYFRQSHARKINYSHHIIEGCFNIPAKNLLFEETIIEQKIEVVEHKNWIKYFYKLPYQDIPDFKIQTTYLPFDMLAASFYLLSRYEEYLIESRDEHNRFKPENSLAFKEGFLQIPLIDHWVIYMGKLLKNHYPDLVIKENRFRQKNTIDIDIAYKYKGLGLIQKLRKFSGSLWRGKVDFHALNSPQIDPYDTYDFLHSTASEDAETMYFLLLADYGGYDKNIPPKSKEMRHLVNTLSRQFTTGLHPSYKSALRSETHEKEHQIFEELVGKKVEISRHHFLKIKLPESYRVLEKMGVKDDYSLAYSTQVGFRASSAFPFLFYDLPNEKTLAIRLHSPCVMDVTLKNSLQLDIGSACKKILELKEKVKAVEGEFISIWHNSNFDETQGWGNWKQVYRSLFE
ncbi:MAG: polysaccharide deacetylase family protein [bacterium]|nr:polysaccharide deacetylase family protein [bacterium]